MNTSRWCRLSLPIALVLVWTGNLCADNFIMSSTGQGPAGVMWKVTLLSELPSGSITVFKDVKKTAVDGVADDSNGDDPNEVSGFIMSKKNQSGYCLAGNYYHIGLKDFKKETKEVIFKLTKMNSHKELLENGSYFKLKATIGDRNSKFNPFYTGEIKTFDVIGFVADPKKPDDMKTNLNWDSVIALEQMGYGSLLISNDVKFDALRGK